MANSFWQRRVERAQELLGQHPFAAEMLGFYIQLAHFQKELQLELEAALPRPVEGEPFRRELNRDELQRLCPRFESLLSLAERHGPRSLSEISRKLRHRREIWTGLLNQAWSSDASTGAESLLAAAFLQPYAELLRSQAQPVAVSTTPAVCPFCSRKPLAGVLRQMGDGAGRSLVCSFCLGEWTFRRLICPACGEENDRQLPVFTASEFDYIRVECCDTCKTYLKTIDLTKNGHADPLVDELASAPLDLWAREHGYAKIRLNLLGM